MSEAIPSLHTQESLTDTSSKNTPISESLGTSNTNTNEGLASNSETETQVLQNLTQTLEVGPTKDLPVLLDQYIVSYNKPIQSLLTSVPENLRESVIETIQQLIKEKEANCLQLQEALHALLDDENKGSLEPIAEQPLQDQEFLKDPGLIQGIDTTSLKKLGYKINNSWQAILPALLAFDTSISLITGRQPELMYLVRQIEEVTDGVPTNTTILLRLGVPNDVLEKLQQDEITAPFFDFFKSNQGKLLSFFDQITRSSGNMYLLLNKMSRRTIERLVTEKELPGPIHLDEKIVEGIFSKLKPYERVKLGVQENKLEMIG